MTTLTYGEVKNPGYRDWLLVDGIGADYQSYFITGYKLHGEGLRRFQGNYLVVYSDIETNSGAKVQYLWDYANDAAGHRFSTAEEIYLTRSYVSKTPRRLWLRGQGLALQMKFYSETGKPFNIIGYAIFESAQANV